MIVTHDDIVSILGPVDESLASEIVGTGASAAELMQAWAWVNNDEALLNDGHAPPSGRVALLVDLLAPEDDEID